VVAAATCALGLIEKGEGRAALWRNANAMHRGLSRLGLLPVAAPGPVGAIRMPGIKAGLEIWRALLRGGVYVNMLIPPATPGGEVLLRYSVSSAHQPEQIEAALAIIEEVARSAGLLPAEPRQSIDSPG
jgi:8-amino-7-oxononanoate synthase